MPATATNCIAQWDINYYTITFDANGGIGGTTPSVAYGATPAAPTVTRVGYTFDSWSPAVVPVTGTATYTAQWTINQYSITFDSAGGTAVNTITQDYGTSIATPTPPTKTGYTFAGWLPVVPTTMPATATNCVAQWTINQYSVIFDSAGGTAVGTITQNYGTAVTAPIPPTKAGYTFAGWLPVVPSTMPATATTCVAQWTIKQYTITYDSAGGSAVGTITQNFGTAVATPIPPTKACLLYTSP